LRVAITSRDINNHDLLRATWPEEDLMDQAPTVEKKSFEDEYGFKPVEEKAMGYWVAVPSYLQGFFPWEKVCSVAVARGRSLTEAELKALIEVDDIDLEIGDTCQFPNCGHKVTAVKGLLVDFTTGEPILDRDNRSIERGSYVVIFEPDKGFVVRLFCPKHAWIARQQEGKKPLPLQSLAAAKARAAVLNARREQDQASLETFREQTGRGIGRPSGRPKGQEFPGEGQRRTGGRGRRW